MSGTSAGTAPHVHVVAEMACSHDGDEGLARTIIDGAGEAAADSVQFQVWQAEDVMVPYHTNFGLLKSVELKRDSWKRLADYSLARYPSMEIIACVYDRNSADFCADFGATAFKLHSADLANPLLVRHIAKTSKRIDLSVGASTLDEIAQALEWIRAESDSLVWLMYGYQSFPTPPDGIHMDYLMTLRQVFGLPVGYQDHSAGGTDSAFFVPAAAAGMGVEAIEKHITHDRSKKGVDHEAALNPDEFRQFCQMLREIEMARGSRHPRPFSEREMEYRKYSRKSTVAAVAIEAGTTIAPQHLAFMRAQDLGLPPNHAPELLGRKARRTVPAFQLLNLEDTEPA